MHRFIEVYSDKGFDLDIAGFISCFIAGFVFTKTWFDFLLEDILLCNLVSTNTLSVLEQIEVTYVLTVSL